MKEPLSRRNVTCCNQEATAYLQLLQNVHVHVKTCGFFPMIQCSLDSKLDQCLRLSPHYMHIKTIVYDR